MILTFESVDEILWYDHSNETSSAVLSHGATYIKFYSKLNLRFVLNFDLGTLGSERVNRATRCILACCEVNPKDQSSLS